MLSRNSASDEGWKQTSCAEADRIRAQGLRVSSSLTDISGTYGAPTIFTEWMDGGDGTPVLRDVLDMPHSPEAECRHWVVEDPLLVRLIRLTEKIHHPAVTEGGCDFDDDDIEKLVTSIVKQARRQGWDAGVKAMIADRCSGDSGIVHYPWNES